MRERNYLRDYLYFNNLTIKDLAQSINYDPKHLTHYMSGHSRMGKKCAHLIEVATQGELKAEKLLEFNIPKPSETKKRSVAKKL